MKRWKFNDLAAAVPVAISLAMGAQLLASRLAMKEQTGLAQRPINRKKVRLFARLMREKKWIGGCDEPIRVSPEGYLLNGQHRLEAQQMVGCTLYALIQYNVPREYILVMDEGTKRTAADALTIRGVTNATHTAAAVKLFMRLRKGPRALRNSAYGILTNNEVYEMTRKHPQLVAWVSVVRGHSGLGRGFEHICEASVMGAFLYALETISSKEKVAHFSECLMTGTHLAAKDPRLSCRNALIALRIRDEHKGAGARLRKFAYLTITWNRWCKSQERVRLVWNRASPFPRPIGRLLWPAAADEKRVKTNE
jgi:hypothetical protein